MRACIGSFTRLLHAERYWVISVPFWISRSRCLQSSFAMSVHFILGLSCLLVSCTYPWSASFGYLVWSILAHDQTTALTVAVCDLLRPGLDQPYHTPLYSWSCFCELLLQSSSNRTFLFSCVCIEVQVSELCTNTVTPPTAKRWLSVVRCVRNRVYTL